MQFALSQLINLIRHIDCVWDYGAKNMGCLTEVTMMIAYSVEIAWNRVRREHSGKFKDVTKFSAVFRRPWHVSLFVQMLMLSQLNWTLLMHPKHCHLLSKAISISALIAQKNTTSHPFHN